MEPLKIKVDSKSSDTSEDVDREEQKWEQKGESYIRGLQSACDKQSQIFNVASHKCKKKYNGYSIPAIIIPLVMSVVNTYIPDEYEYVNTITMCCVGILNGLNTFFNHGKMTERYGEYSGKYAELSQQIAVELSKPRRFRIPLDVFTERVSTRKLALDAGAPFI